MEEKKRYRISIYIHSKNTFTEITVENTLTKALQEALRKGQPFEVFEINAKGDPLVEVRWRHLV